MSSELEMALAEGGEIEEKTDLEKAIEEGGQIEDTQKESEGLAFLNRGIASVLGAPVDVMQSALEMIPGYPKDVVPIGGRKSIESGMKATGIRVPEEGEQPASVSEYMGQTVGEVTGMLVPFTKMLQTASRGTGLVSRVSKSIYDQVIAHPWIAGASEVTGGAGAGSGRYIKEEVLPPDSITGQFAEPVGGITGGLVPVALTYTPARIAGKYGKTILKKIASPFTEEGSKYRAGKFLKKQVTDTTTAAGKVIEDTIGDLPPAVASGEKRLMKLYNQLRDADPVTDASEIKKLYNSINKLEQELRSMGYAAPEALHNVTAKRVASIQLNMQRRVSDAMSDAQRKIDALPVSTRQSQESVIVRKEIEKVMRKAINDPDTGTRALWAKVPKDVDVGFSESQTTYRNILKDLSKAQFEDVPSPLRNSILVTNPPGGRTTVKEMQGLRSKLLEVERMARKNGEWNKARIAGDVADSILDDLESEGADEALKTAISATRAFKERFERGIVGRILGYSKSGAPSISPEVTLDISIGRSGIAGSIDVEKIVVTPEAQAATKRYIARSFTDYTTDSGTKEFNVRKASRWVENNRELLDKFPDLQTQLNDINKAKQYADDTLSVMTQRMENLRDPRISTAAKFLGSEPGQEIDNIFKSKNPVKATTELVRQARKDTTGEALEGLKGAYIDHLMEKASVGTYNEVGEKTLSGNALLGFINKNGKALKTVFSADEMARLQKIGSELAQIDKLDKLRGRMIDINMDDAASNFLHLINRVGGAQFGRWVAKMTGGGTVQTPGIFSERFKMFSKYITKDRAFQLIHDAITADDGGKLLRTLLLPIDKPTVPSTKLNIGLIAKRINLWLLGSGSRVMDDIKQDIEEEQNSTVGED